jgi:predicted nucleic acid-binding protein
MPCLLDTGILLRVVNRQDALHEVTRLAVRMLKIRGDETVTTLQNISEFWNVCTRPPPTARGGQGFTVEQTERRLSLVERFVRILPEPAGLYGQWRNPVIAHRVLGVQVHDAKLVAAMNLHRVDRILTHNQRDFARYNGIQVLTPAQVVV